VRTGGAALTVIAILGAGGAISAEGITLTHRTPALALCRALTDAGFSDRAMAVIDQTTRKPVMAIRSIHAAAGLSVMENAKFGPRFVKWVPFTGIGSEE